VAAGSPDALRRRVGGEVVQAVDPAGRVEQVLPTDGSAADVGRVIGGLPRSARVTVRRPSMDEVFLHLTGDVHAIGAAHNLAGAFIDNSLHHKNPLGIDPHGILWPRVVDISDRALRHVVIGLGGREDGIPRETEFVITVGSEVMAVLALATDLFDLRARLGRIVLATRADGTAVTAEDRFGQAGVPEPVDDEEGVVELVLCELDRSCRSGGRLLDRVPDRDAVGFAASEEAADGLGHEGERDDDILEAVAPEKVNDVPHARLAE